MNENEWIRNLNPGDRVWRTRPDGRCSEPYIVSRVTKSVVFIRRRAEDTYEYGHNRDTGRSRGTSSWSSEYVVAKSKCNDLCNLLGTPNTLEECKALIAALTPFVKAKDGDK